MFLTFLELIYCFIQGASKKCLIAIIALNSVPGVGFYFFRGVLEPEFCAQSIFGNLIIPIMNLKCLKNAEKACTDMRKEHYISEYLDFM